MPTTSKPPKMWTAPPPAGFTFFTIDPSPEVDGQADDYAEPPNYEPNSPPSPTDIDWVDKYRAKKSNSKPATSSTLDAQPVIARRRQIRPRHQYHGLELARTSKAATKNSARTMKSNSPSMKPPQPTTLAEHYIIADQVRCGGMKLVSLAPRFVGDFEKGVDYKRGRATAGFEKALADHAAIPEQLGPYKLSLHSGSDKLSIYALRPAPPEGMFHVKTAGTSYLEALRVVARHDEPLFRASSISPAAAMMWTKQHITSAQRSPRCRRPPIVKDPRKLEDLYLERWENVPPGCGFTQPGRQILHCTFGSTLTHPRYKTAIQAVVAAHPATCQEVLRDHFVRHLKALQSQ